MQRFLLQAVLSTCLIAVGCSDPKCPQNLVQHGMVCKRCPDGSEAQHNKCVDLDSGVVVEPLGDGGLSDADAWVPDGSVAPVQEAGTLPVSDAQAQEAGPADAADFDADPRDTGTAEAAAPDATASDGQAPEGGSDAGCGAGYVLNGGSCRDVDECFEGTHACHPTATCRNTAGSYDCDCRLGYSGGSNAGFACAPRIAVGDGHRCVLLTDGTVRCWGGNTYGQLGDGTQMERAVPVQVTGLSNVATISAGGSSMCALLRDGTVRCWGANTSGQLGDGTVMNRNAPVSVLQVTGAASIAASAGHTCAVLNGGALRCWGGNSSGQLGNGSSSATPVSSPVGVSAITTATNVFVGNDQTCAVLRSGAAQCWGRGFLGDAAISSSLTPVDARVPQSVAALGVGTFHACSLHGNGDVYCWGPANAWGSTSAAGAPWQVLGAGPGTGLGIGFYTTYVLQTSGTTKWIEYGNSQMLISALSQGVAISTYGADACELLADGTVTCWWMANAVEGGPTPVAVPGIDLW